MTWPAGRAPRTATAKASAAATAPASMAARSPGHRPLTDQFARRVVDLIVAGVTAAR